MPIKARTLRPILRPILVLTLCGLALTAYEVGGSSPAAARGGVAFGHMGEDSGSGGMAWAVAACRRVAACHRAANGGSSPTR
jgi:hypothetical protein